MRVKRIFLLWAVFTFLVVLSKPAAYGVTGQTVLGEIQKRYETANDFEADFLQEYIGKVMMRPQKGEGKVYFKKKGMMRWDYRVPNYQLITNGQTLWYHQPEDKQVFVSGISKVIKEKTPLAFLAGEGNLTRDFTLLNLDESKDGHYGVELAPKEANPALGKLSLTVDRKTHLIVQVDVFDGLGNVTRTRFLNIKTNVGLPDSLFQFAKPPGTEELRFQEPDASSPGRK
jgi:outer membrane lipoprotein carrier protein